MNCAYKIKEKDDGSISAYVFRDEFGVSHYPNFQWFMEELLRNSRGSEVICSPPLVPPEGEEWSDDEEFERVGFDEQEIEKIKGYYSYKNLRISLRK